MNRERQKEAIDQGLRTEIDEGAAALTAIPQATLDAILGRLFVGKLGLTNRAVGGGGIFTRGVKGAAAGAVVEAPTELGQQVLERAQAGLPLTSEDAIAEYREAAIAGGLLGGSIRGTATIAGGDVAAREDAQKAKEERDAAIRRAETEATLAAEAATEAEAAERQAEVERRIREGEPAPPVVEETTQPAPPVVSAATEITTSEQVTGEEVTGAQVEDVVEIAQSEKSPTTAFLDNKFFDDIGFGKTAKIRKELTGKDLTDPDVQDDLRRAAAKTRSKKKLEIQANLEEAFKKQEAADDQQRDVFTDTERELVEARSREGVESDISSVGLESGSADTERTTTPVGQPVADVGTDAGRVDDRTRTESGALTEQDMKALGDELNTLLSVESRSPEQESRLSQLTSLARAEFARRQKPPEDTREASLELEEGVVTEEQAAIDAETEAQATELSDAIDNILRRKADIEGDKFKPVPPVQIAPSLADPNNIRTQQIRDFHADRVAEAKELGEEPPTLAQSRDEFTIQESLDPNLRRMEGTRYSAVSDADFTINEDVVAGRLTEQEHIAESDRLLRETKGGTLIDAVNNVARNANSPFEQLVATNVSKLMQRMADVGYKFEYEIEELDFNQIKNGTRGLTH